MDEIAADYTRFFMDDIQAFKRFANESKEHGKIAQLLIDAFHWVMDKIKALSGKELDSMQQALKLWEDAYIASKKTVKKPPGI